MTALSLVSIRWFPATLAVAQFTTLFGVVHLLEGMALALTPHRVPAVAALAAIGDGLAAFVGLAEVALGLGILAVRLLHVSRLAVLLPLFGAASLSWVPIVALGLATAPILTVLPGALLVGGLVAPLRLGFAERAAVTPRLDLGELLIGLVTVVQGALLLSDVSLLQRSWIPGAAPVLSTLGILAGAAFAAARPLHLSLPRRLASGIACGLFQLSLAVGLAQVGLWGAALLSVSSAVLVVVAGSRLRLPTMVGPISLRNRAAVVVGMSTTAFTILVAAIGSSMIGGLAPAADSQALAASLDLLFVVVVLICCLSTLLSLYVSRCLGSELTLFGQALSRIAAGQLDEPLPSRRGDERDVVIEAFEAMRIRLRAQLGELEQNAARLLRVHRATLRLSGRVDERELAQNALDAVLELLDATAGGVWLREPARKEMRLTASRGEVAAVLPSVQQMADVPRGSQHVQGMPLARDRFLVAPLVVGNLEQVGVLALMRSGSGGTSSQPSFGNDDILLLEFFAAVLAGSIQTSRLFAYVGRLEGQRQTERLKAEFLTSVSHELRTPLSIIHGYAELLRDREFQPRQLKRIGDEVFKASSALARMVDDLLDYSRLEAGRFRLKLEPVDVPEVVTEAVSLFRHEIVNQVMLIEHGGDVPLIMADGDRVRQAVSNLVSNALKYGPPDGRIRVRTTYDGSRVKIAIQDEGPGVPVGERARIFERFYRSPEQQNSTVRGVGLGLAVVRAVAEGHGGDVGVDQAPRGGSIFWFSLPATAVTAPEVEAESQEPVLV